MFSLFNACVLSRGGQAEFLLLQNPERFRCSEGMASTAGRHDEVHNFVRKLLSLHGAGRAGSTSTAMVNNCGSPSAPSLVSNQVRPPPSSLTMVLSPPRAKPNHHRPAAAAAREVGPAGRLAEPDVCSQPSPPSLSTAVRLTRLQ